MAVTVVHLESQRIISPVAFEETADGTGFTARAALTVEGQPVTGQPGRGASKKTGRQFAALSLVARLAGLPDPVGQTQDPDTGDTRSRAIGSEDLLAAMRDRTPPVPPLAVHPVARPDVGSLRDHHQRRRRRCPSAPRLDPGGYPRRCSRPRRHDQGRPGGHRARVPGRHHAAARRRGPGDRAGPQPAHRTQRTCQVGAITDLGFTVTAAGPPHDPVFTCSAACRHADAEISGAAPASHVRAVSSYAASPAGVADRLLQAGGLRCVAERTAPAR